MADITFREEEVVVGAKKANKDLGNVLVGGKHLLSTKEGKGILETYEKAELINKDHLTGLYNRRGFDEQLRLMHAHARRMGENLSIAFLDADKFKNINTKYGRLKGDEVLKSIAVSMRESFRASDILARWGGDEFVAIMLFSKDVEIIKDDELSLRINKNLQDHTPFGVDRSDVSVTVGVMSWDKTSSLYDFQKQVQDRMDSRK
ncbi:MAG: GGDEF protein [uncultured bacterium]|nr:MAG: GGDEF protein [uncultured bacterium]